WWSREFRLRMRVSASCAPPPDGFSLQHREALIHHLIFAHAPDVGRADVASMIADIDAAPAAAAPADAADDALLRIVSDFRGVIRPDADRPRGAGFDDSCAAIREHGDEHPALRSVRILDQAPRLVFLDHANWQLAALVEPDVGVIATWPGVGHCLPTGDRCPVRRLLFLRCGGGCDKKKACCVKSSPERRGGSRRLTERSTRSGED